MYGPTTRHGRFCIRQLFAITRGSESCFPQNERAADAVTRYYVCRVAIIERRAKLDSGLIRRSMLDRANTAAGDSLRMEQFDCFSRAVRPTSELTHCPANVPQRHANQAMHARYAAHARTFFPKRFVNIENKGSKIQLPKLKVASSSLVARSKFGQ